MGRGAWWVWFVGGNGVWGFVGGGEEEEAAGGGLGVSGDLKGDLKGWERVVVAVSRRRRFEGWMGDMVGRDGERDGWGRALLRSGCGVVGEEDSIRWEVEDRRRDGR